MSVEILDQSVQKTNTWLKDIQTLASRPTRDRNSVLTLYLDVNQSEQANLNRGFENQIEDMLDGIRKRIADPEESDTFEAASKRLKEFARTYAVRGQGIVVVVDVSDGFLWNKEIEFPLRNEIRWGRDVFLHPLAVAVDEYERVGIILLDRANARVLTMFLGRLEEEGREGIDHKKVRHTKTVGMNRVVSASQAQRRADEQIRMNLRRVVKDLDVMSQRQRFQRIILLGSPEMSSALKALLPKRLLSMVIGTTDITIDASVEEIRNVALPIGEQFERDLESDRVNDLITSAAKSRRVVIGLDQTLSALYQDRVWQLLYSEEFHAAGYECTACGALFSDETDTCAQCDSKVTAVEDVVERAVENAVRKGVRIEVIRNERSGAPFLNAGGIGAFLRTRTASLRVS